MKAHQSRCGRKLILCHGKKIRLINLTSKTNHERVNVGQFNLSCVFEKHTRFTLRSGCIMLLLFLTSTLNIHKYADPFLTSMQEKRLPWVPLWTKARPHNRSNPSLDSRLAPPNDRARPPSGRPLTSPPPPNTRQLQENKLEIRLSICYCHEFTKINIVSSTLLSTCAIHIWQQAI